MGSDASRSYAFLNPDELAARDVPPVDMTAEQALHEGLLDLIQFSESDGVDPGDVDRILEEIVADRARRGWTLRGRPPSR